jgi:hypothetical protein
MRRSSALAALLGTLWMAWPGAARSQVCSFDPLLHPAGGGPGAGPLDLLLVEGDGKGIAAARETVDRVLDACAGASPVRPEGWVFMRLYEPYRPTLRATVEAFFHDQTTSSPIFSSVLGGGGVPVPQRAQIGLAQVVTAGQPGLLASVAGKVWPTDPSEWKRHLTVAGSIFVVQPTIPDPGKTFPDPQFGALDLLAGYDSHRTTYDWSAEFADSVIDDLTIYEEPGYLSSVTLLQLYRDRRKEIAAAADAQAQAIHAKYDPASAATADAGRRAQLVAERDAELASLRANIGTLLNAALAQAAVTARRQYGDAVTLHFRRKYIEPEIERERNDRYFTLSVRFRYSDDARFVPELPDLLSAGLDATGHAAFVGTDTTLGVQGEVHGAYSRDPTALCPTRGAPTCRAQDAALAEANGGLAFTTGAGGGHTVLNAGGTFRYRFGDRIVTATDGAKRDYSGGVLISLQVPLTAGVAVIGTYSTRWYSWTDKVTTSSLTISKSLGTPATPLGLK